MYPTQTNTVDGMVTKLASGAITAGNCVKLDSQGKVTAVSAVSDRVLFVALETVADGQPVMCQPLSPESNIRIRAGTVSGTQNAGLPVYLAAIPAADGRINEVVAGATKVGYAEEPFVTNQLVLIRPIPAS
jgi:hypothetical protein